MWSDAAGGGGFNTSFGGDDGAGFGTQQYNSPGPDVKRSRRIESVLPVTIDVVNKLNENDQVYLGAQVNMVTVVGLICEVEVSSTKVTYTVDDTTGTIHVIKWLDAENEEETLMENTYCRVHGTFKTHQDMKQILALHIEPITNYNWITAHILEVVYTALKLQNLKDSDGGMGKNNGTMAGSSMPNSLVGFGGLASTSGNASSANTNMYNAMGLTPQQKTVFEEIRLAADGTDDSGFSRDHVKSKLKGKMTPNQVDDALYFLCSEGHIYTTVDEDHFRATDG